MSRVAHTEPTRKWYSLPSESGWRSFAVVTNMEESMRICPPQRAHQAVCAKTAGRLWPESQALTRRDGTVWTWGSNSIGQLGCEVPRHDYFPSPQQVPGVEDVVDVAAGGSGTLVVLSDGRVMGWGAGNVAVVGDGTTEDRPRPTLSLATDVVDIDAGDFHALALTSAGTLLSWGHNISRALGLNSVEEVVATPTPVPDMTGVISMSTGGNHGLAVKDDETLWAWGRNQEGQMGDDTTYLRRSPVEIAYTSWDPFVRVHGGENNSFAIDGGGVVWAWGSNDFGQLCTGGSVELHVPSKVPQVVGAVKVTGGLDHTFFLMDDGTLWGCGADGYGQMGNGPGQSGMLMAIPGFEGVVDVAASLQASFVVLDDGTLWSWGRNQHGKLGHGDLENREEPTLVRLPSE